jgi:hypothetical protein
MFVDIHAQKPPLDSAFVVVIVMARAAGWKWILLSLAVMMMVDGRCMRSMTDLNHFINRSLSLLMRQTKDGRGGERGQDFWSRLLELRRFSLD